MYFGIKKKVNEEDDSGSLSKRISRKAFLLGAKLNNIEDPKYRQEVIGALSLLNQAQMVKDKKEALRLLNMANRLGQN